MHHKTCGLIVNIVIIKLIKTGKIPKKAAMIITSFRLSFCVCVLCACHCLCACVRVCKRSACLCVGVIVRVCFITQSILFLCLSVRTY